MVDQRQAPCRRHAITSEEDQACRDIPRARNCRYGHSVRSDVVVGPLKSIWAEDGWVWLTDALHRGFLHALTTPYNGYLQNLGRLIAEPVAVLPVRWYAPAIALVGADIVTSCTFVVWRASAGYLESRYLRAALAAMIVLLPVVDVERLDNVTNSIWFFCVAAQPLVEHDGSVG